MKIIVNKGKEDEDEVYIDSINIRIGQREYRLQEDKVEKHLEITKNYDDETNSTRLLIFPRTGNQIEIK